MQIKSKTWWFEYLYSNSWSYFHTCFFLTTQPEMVKNSKQLNSCNKGTTSTMEKLDLCAGTVCVKHNYSQSQTKLLPDSSSAEIRNASCRHEICWKANYSTEFHWNAELQRNPGNKKGSVPLEVFHKTAQSSTFQSQRKLVTSWGLTALLWFGWQ